MNARTGSIYKRGTTWYARVTYTDPVTGKRKDLRRKAESKLDATRLRDRLLSELDGSGGKSVIHERKTFADFARHYERDYLQPAKYIDGRKVSGLRSWYT